jgi:hypothetical protein
MIVLGGVVGAAVHAAPAEAATTTWSPQTLGAQDLQVGDMVSGPNGTVVRVHELAILSTGRVRVRYTDPRDGVTQPVQMSSYDDETGFDPLKGFVVYARDVSEDAAKMIAAMDPPVLQVVDGGRP